MNFTKYEQRLAVVGPLDFGIKATLENGIWRAVQHEELMIPPTNMNISQKLLLIKNAKHKKRKPTPEQIHLQHHLGQYGDLTNRQQLMEPLNNKNHNYHYNPFRSNSYAIGQLGKDTYMVLPCGNSLTELRIVLMATQSLSLANEDNCRWTSDGGTPLGSLSSAAWVNMVYPILQIRVSTALDVTKADVDTMIIGVRTIRYTSVFKFVRNQQSHSIHLLHRFDPSFGNSNARLCSPVHIVLSPYFGHQYAFVGDNGYLAVFDIRRVSAGNPHGVIFETNLHLKEDSKVYSRRWKSCVFGPHPKTLIVASSRHVSLLDFKTEMCSEKILYSCAHNQRIYCLQSLGSRNTFQFCLSTNDQIILLDTRYPNQPIISWKHHFNDNPPTLMELTKDPLNSGIVNILAWPLEQDSAIHLQYQYSGHLELSSMDEPASVKPALYSRPNFIAFKTHMAKFLYQEERIPVIGTATKTTLLRCVETGQSKQLMVVFRLLNNGAVHTQRFIMMDEYHPDFDRPPLTPLKQQQGWTLDIPCQQQRYQLPLNDGILVAHNNLKQMESMNRYSKYQEWNSSAFFKGIIHRAIMTKLDVHKSGVHLHKSNLLEVRFPSNMKNLVDLTTELWQLDRRSLENFDDVIQNHHFSRPKSAIKASNVSDWIPLPGQDDNMDSAYQAITNNICNKLGKYNRTQARNRKELNHHFASDMYAHLMIYLPVTTTDNSPQNAKPHRQFRYLQRQDTTFEPTASTLLMAHDWNITDSEIHPPDLLRANTTFDPDRPLFQYHKIVPVAPLKRRSSTSVHSQELRLPPTISSSYPTHSTQDLDTTSTIINEDKNSAFTSISTQPSPGVFANRKRPSSEPKKKKKKKTVSGFM